MANDAKPIANPKAPFPIFSPSFLRKLNESFNYAPYMYSKIAGT